MYSFTFYAAFLGAILSNAGFAHLALKEHDSGNPRTLSRLAAQKSDTLRKFRLTIWLGGTFIAVTVFFFIVPRIVHGPYVALSFGLMYCSALLLSIIPDRDKKETFIHSVFGWSMYFGTLLTAMLFIVGLHGSASYIEGVLTAIMVFMPMIAFVDFKRFIFYEIPFIGLSHISILVAAIALR